MPTNYISILDANGVPAKVQAEEIATSEWVQLIKIVHGDAGEAIYTSKRRPLPIVPGTHVEGDINETAFSISTNGDNLIVPGFSVHTIYLWGFMIQNQASTNQSVLFRSNTMNMNPTIILPPYGFWTMAFMGRPHFFSNPSEDLNIFLVSPPGAVVGKLWYTQE